MRRRLSQGIILICLSGLLTACEVGPNFKPPAAPPTQTYTPTPVPKQTVATKASPNAGKSQTISFQQQLPSNWWYLFQSPQIDALIKEGVANSPTLVSAQATLEEAQATYYENIGNLLFPAINLNMAAKRQESSLLTLGGSTTNKTFNLYNVAPNVTYTVDAFGGSRRQLEELKAQVDYEQYELQATYLTLTSNIASTAIALASLQNQIEATRALIAEQKDVLKITKEQYRYGGVSEQNVLSQETELAQTEATLPPLVQAEAQTAHSLAVLTGNFTSQQPTPKINLDKLHLPDSLPVSLPSNLVQQRPDIQASQALWHEASANIGVATANIFPQIQLTGSYGWLSESTGSFFNPSNVVWSIGSTLTQPLFHGAALWEARKAAIDAFNVAGANYRETVLNAFANVADSLTAIQQDAVQYQQDFAAYNSAKKNMVIVQQQYKLGGESYLTALTAEEQYQETRLALIKAQAARYSDTVALFQSVGGGWWNPPIQFSK